MSAGYGRGHYGSEQLAPRRSGGWLSTALVLVGVGAVAWLVWPRRSALVPTYAPDQAVAPAADPRDEVEQIARSRGFSSGEAFENSVVATARELEASGARVDLGPHLQHLTPRLET